MDLKGLPGGLYKPLTRENIETIHKASLTILEKTGVTYEKGLDDTLDMLDMAGAQVDRDSARITFPGELIIEQAEKAPHQVILFSRNGEYDLDLAEHNVHLGTGGAAINILDLETGKSRSTTLNDLYQIARLVDCLDNIHFFVRPCVATECLRE